MSFDIKYSDLVETLARDMAVSIVLPGDTNIRMFKSRLSQAKFRQAVEGKLDFSHTYNITEGHYTMTIVLQPPKTTTAVKILSINSKGGL